MKIDKICINAINVESYGISVYCSNVISNLKKYYPHLNITLYINSNIKNRFIGIDKMCDIKIININSSIIRQLFLLTIFPFLIKVKKYDILHSVGNMGIIFSFIPQFITIHDTYEKIESKKFNKLKSLFIHQIISLSGINSKSIFAVSMNTQKDIHKYYPRLKRKTKVIYSGNPLNIPTNHIEYERSDFLFIGIKFQGKNIYTVLKALRILVQKHDCKLYVIGEPGKDFNSIKNLIKTLGIEKHVIFTGFISNNELIQHYLKRKALIFSSTYEGFGLPVIEALSFSCPVIAANNSAIPEAAGSNALFFDTYDHEMLANHMCTVYQNDSSITKMIQNGKNYIKKFDWQETVKQIYEAYKTHFNFRYS